nr:MAG TPA: hypothetical protein [Caudoviricetes sp.]
MTLFHLNRSLLLHVLYPQTLTYLISISCLLS